MKTIVVSAVNLRKGGTLTILRDCLSALSELAEHGECRVVALVHDRRLAEFDGIEYIEIPWSVRSWLHRLWCEYITMYGISKRIGDIDLWFSLHDTTPWVEAKRQAVYCHNSYPFFRWCWRHWLLNYRIVSFSVFTKWFYRINLSRNAAVVVQAEWFREAFNQMTGFPVNQIIVATPAVIWQPIGDKRLRDGKFHFIYPAYPDVHKNLETLCEAARLLEQEVGKEKFQVLLTTNRQMNAYSRWLYEKWGHVESILFGGFLDKESLFQRYAEADCLVFPSQVETWGLPISEFAATGRPMLLADLPYAHETSQGSKLTAFFPVEDPVILKDMMKSVMTGDISGFTGIPQKEIAAPTAAGWSQLIALILNHEDTTTR